MKAAMTILVCVLATAAQNPRVIQETRAKMNGVRDSEAAASNAALSLMNQAPSAAKPTPAPAKTEGGTAVGNSAGTSGAGDNKAGEGAAGPDNKWNAAGKRDPFVSPVVSREGGSGCNTGKKCLEIGTINLQGIVRTESGFIAVVSNIMNKAYFLHENDPVFNGYVMKITNDSVVFEETLQDRLGKTFTREVVKKLTVPAV